MVSGETVSVVVPVYKGEMTLEPLIEELDALGASMRSESDPSLQITEVILVHDCGPGDSARVMQELEERCDLVRCVWLTRNFGQHAATIAGISASSGDWVVTIDEDGLHDPAVIPTLIEHARREGVPLAYGQPSEGRPHAWYRNLTSDLAKWIFRILSGQPDFAEFTSFRAIEGPQARILAAYCGHGVYLDVALTWIVDGATGVPVRYRTEGRASGYRMRSLLSHFRRLVLTSGTQPLRFIAAVGFAATLLGIVLSITLILMRLFSEVDAAGWTSVMLTITVFSGLILMALGIVAEYLSVAVTMATGRPLYVTRAGPPD